MRVRHPPGRAGRPWLAHRLAVARRGAELLDEKARALVAEQRRLEPLVQQARWTWEARARAAERALLRAAVIGGERTFLTGGRATPAQLTVDWHTVLGVVCPADARVMAPAAPERLELGSAALITAAEAHARALDAAVRVAVLGGALERVTDALHATALRRNALDRRWIPAHEDALAALELHLEELEREEATRVRWATRARSP